MGLTYILYIMEFSPIAEIFYLLSLVDSTVHYSTKKQTMLRLVDDIKSTKDEWRKCVALWFCMWCTFTFCNNSVLLYYYRRTPFSSRIFTNKRNDSCKSVLSTIIIIIIVGHVRIVDAGSLVHDMKNKLKNITNWKAFKICCTIFYFSEQTFRKRKKTACL